MGRLAAPHVARRLQKGRFARVDAENRTVRRYTREMDFKFVSRTLLLAATGVCFAVPALAQWQWIDKDGRKVYSDRSPPSDIQEKNILKRPAGAKGAAAPVITETVAAAPAAGASAPAAKPNANAPKLSGKDAQLEARKKQAEEEEAAKKKAEEEKVAKAKADNCERTKKGLASLQSGVRLATTNAKGEREIMDDNARAAEAKRLQGIADSDCK
jgi:hypothetical protein